MRTEGERPLSLTRYLEHVLTSWFMAPWSWSLQSNSRREKSELETTKNGVKEAAGPKGRGGCKLKTFLSFLAPPKTFTTSPVLCHKSGQMGRRSNFLLKDQVRLDRECGSLPLPQKTECYPRNGAPHKAEARALLWAGKTPWLHGKTGRLRQILGQSGES